MSGTSLDGVDIVLAKFKEEDNNWSFEILASKTFSYTTYWNTELKNVFHSSAQHLAMLDGHLGMYFGYLVNTFCDEFELDKSQIDLIASHGHTIFHNPIDQYTTQIGSGAHIAATTGIKTVCDFRSQDVALGGQGAPLVPAGDKYLFNEYPVCINLGGFSNITVKGEEGIIAYDICPVNMALNFYAQREGMSFDEDGKLARRGSIHGKLLNELNQIGYYGQKAPKSLSKEWFNAKFVPYCEYFDLSTKDTLRTLTEHIAMQLSKVLNNLSEGSKVLITGGGAFNLFLIELLNSKTKCNIIVPEPDIVQYKEALIFAFLGVLRVLGRENTLSSVTGAQKSGIGGCVYLP